MSLMSLLTTNSNQSTYGYGTSLTGVTSTTATTQATTSSTAATASAGSASISTAAQIAAAEKTDNAKDFTTLSSDVRAALDAGYAAGGKSSAPDLSEMSGRALAAIILNKTNAFSSSEQAAAKTELAQRTRDEFTTALSSTSSGLTGLTSYNQLLVSEYDSISPEERQARGWTSALRSSAADFVSSTTGSSTGNSSLFDLLNADDQDGTSNTSFF